MNTARTTTTATKKATTKRDDGLGGHKKFFLRLFHYAALEADEKLIEVDASDPNSRFTELDSALLKWQAREDRDSVEAILEVIAEAFYVDMVELRKRERRYQRSWARYQKTQQQSAKVLQFPTATGARVKA